MLSPFLGRASYPSREQHCLVSSLVPAGTGEDICAHIHVANSQGHRAKKGPRSDRRHSANSLWKRVESRPCVTMAANFIVAGLGISGVLRASTNFSKGAKLDMVDATACKPVSVTPRRTLRRYAKGLCPITA